MSSDTRVLLMLLAMAGVLSCGCVCLPIGAVLSLPVIHRVREAAAKVEGKRQAELLDKKIAAQPRIPRFIPPPPPQVQLPTPDASPFGPPTVLLPPDEAPQPGAPPSSLSPPDFSPPEFHLPPPVWCAAPCLLASGTSRPRTSEVSER